VHGARIASALWIAVTMTACARGPVELGFWMEPITYTSARIGDPLSTAELATIESVARAEVVSAFEGFNAIVSDNRHARYHVRVVQKLVDQRFRRRDANVAGESRGMAGFGGTGAVSFEFLAGGTMVYAPDDASRADLVAALGRGIGRSAVHEFAHQLLPRAPIHDTRDAAAYESSSVARIEQYFGEMHWDVAKPLLLERLGPR
jgi:hypothetical protein